MMLVPSNARAAVEVSAGYGLAMVDVGTPDRPFLETHRTRDTVPVARIGVAWRGESGFGLGLAFSDYGQVRERFPKFTT